MKNMGFVAKICILTSGQRHTLCYLIIFLIKSLLHNKCISHSLHSMRLCEVNFCTLTFDIVLEYLEYLIKTSLANPFRFLYFPYPSTESSMFCHPLRLFNHILFILEYVLEYVLRPFCSMGLRAFKQHGFISYSTYLST